MLRLYLSHNAIITLESKSFRFYHNEHRCHAETMSS